MTRIAYMVWALESRGGVYFWADGDLIKWHDPKCMLTPHNIKILMEHREEVLKLIRDRNPSDFLQRHINSVIHGDCQSILPFLPDSCVDQIVCDQPYGQEFMGFAWDESIISAEILSQCERILKSGGFAFVFSAPRQDLLMRTIMSLQSAGLDVDYTSLYWTYASGFPKAHNISKQVGQSNGLYSGFQPKPAVEVIIVAKKPIAERSNTEQAFVNGKAVTHLDDCRIPYQNEQVPTRDLAKQRSYTSRQVPGSLGERWEGNERGRFPGNLLISDDVLGRHSRFFSLDAWAERHLPFLIVPKPTKREKEAALERLAGGLNQTHPCAKPIKLLAYLITMASQPGDLIADVMAGSGSTLIAAKLLGRNYIGIEQDEKYHKLAVENVRHASPEDPYFRKLIDDTSGHHKDESPNKIVVRRKLDAAA